MDNRNIAALADRARQVEVSMGRITSALYTLLEPDVNADLVRLAGYLQEIRFFLAWLKSNPEERDLAVERLINFLTEGEIPNAYAGPEESQFPMEAMEEACKSVWDIFFETLGRPVEWMSANDVAFVENNKQGLTDDELRFARRYDEFVSDFYRYKRYVEWRDSKNIGGKS